MDARPLLICIPVSLLIATAGGCGTTEESGDVGDTLSAKGLEATVEQVDTRVPVPQSDVTGLSLPAAGMKLVGARVSVCSDHGGAIGAFAWGLDSSSGDARQKYPQRNYDDSFDTVRDGCGGGWVVFEIPEDSQPERVTFGVQDTGTSTRPQTRVNAKFSWAIPG
jgi:hypothetical protein